MSKKRLRAPTHDFLNAHSKVSYLQLSLRNLASAEKSTSAREELTPSTLHCKTHLISLRSISCNTLSSKLNDLKKKRCSSGTSSTGHWIVHSMILAQFYPSICYSMSIPVPVSNPRSCTGNFLYINHPVIGVPIIHAYFHWIITFQPSWCFHQFG